jgi:hypothetical protein
VKPCRRSASLAIHRLVHNCAQDSTRTRPVRCGRPVEPNGVDPPGSIDGGAR